MPEPERLQRLKDIRFLLSAVLFVKGPDEASIWVLNLFFDMSVHGRAGVQA